MFFFLSILIIETVVWGEGNQRECGFVITIKNQSPKQLITWLDGLLMIVTMQAISTSQYNVLTSNHKYYIRTWFLKFRKRSVVKKTKLIQKLHKPTSQNGLTMFTFQNSYSSLQFSRRSFNPSLARGWGDRRLKRYARRHWEMAYGHAPLIYKIVTGVLSLIQAHFLYTYMSN